MFTVIKKETAWREVGHGVGGEGRIREAGRLTTSAPVGFGVPSPPLPEGCSGSLESGANGILIFLAE